MNNINEKLINPVVVGGNKPTVHIEPFGPTQEQVQALGSSIANHASVTKYLANTHNRLLSIELVDEVTEQKPERPIPPSRFRAYFTDYTNHRTIIATGPLANPAALEVVESGIHPLPNAEEFAEAVRIASTDTTIGALIREGQLLPYTAMPPLVGETLPDGRTPRVLAIGLLPKEGMKNHEIIAVNMSAKQMIRFAETERGRAPLMAAAHNPICGISLDAKQGTVKSAVGSVWVTISVGSTVLWKFLAVRPAASSGTNGSGIELQFVEYKGKRVLYRAHVPILNVKYDGNACGPYRDWQKEEAMLTATGTDVAPGFRLCSSPATTILDNGIDAGNFLGTAIYVQGTEVVLVNKMQAGWYRYVSQWRFDIDGTIRPRFGFTAVQNSCVCNVHHHHCYWRFDFDIDTPGNNLVREFNDPPIIPGTNWHDKTYEIRRPRDPAHHRKWRVENKSSGDAYDIVPGPEDGEASTFPDAPFGRGDVWVLRYHGNEIDDGVHSIGPPYEADIDAWLTGEPVNGQDVVIWYAGHFTHDVVHEPPGHFGHIVGPDLKLVKW